jgi:aryl-alcohol dehydrogenase-like predicted oxidoreductase
MAQIPGTDLDVFPLCLGSNVFGWTIDRDQSFAVLDAYLAAGGNFIDTADSYSAWVPGNSGGEAEQIIGEWLAARGNRDQVVIATKVGRQPGLEGLAPDTVRRATEDSLRRLGVETVDILYAHADDPTVPLEESLGALGELVSEGKARYLAASNYPADRLADALVAAEREGLPRYVALQPEYNLMERDYEGALQELCQREELACFPYYALASGFLTGKYRPGGGDVDSPRAEGAAKYLDGHGTAVLAALDEVAAAHDSEPAAVALAWLRLQPTVLAPVASARDTAQLRPLLASVELDLSGEDLARLEQAAG